MRLKEERRALVLSALVAAALLLVFSRCSPLYPTNNWGEANAFFTVGRGMLEGKVPYKDLVLGAGPVVYGLHALAALISPGNFIGVWLLEIVFMTALVYLAWRAASRISGMPVLSMGMAALMGLLLVSTRAFFYGDTVEEFALPLQMFALCDLLVYLDDPERRMSTYRLVLHGFLAGCVFWMKYTLAGVHLVFIAAIAIDDMARQWELKGAICMCLEFAAGVVFATAPWIAYFGANGALMTFLRAYLGGNWEYLLSYMNPVRSGIAGIASGIIHNPACALALLCGAGYLLYRLVHRRWNGGCTSVAAAFACAAMMMYFTNDRYRFSPLFAGVFLMLCAGPLALLSKYLWKQKRVYAAAMGCVLALCAGYNCWVNESLPYIGYPEEELPQEIFAKYIEENGGGSVLTYDIPDCGFYLAADQLPEFRIFADSSSYYNSSMSGADYRYVERQEPDWVITRDNYAPGGYYLQMTASSPYDGGTKIVDSKDDMPAEQNRYTYYLYGRTYAEPWPE